MRKAISSHARAKSVGRWSGLLSVSVISLACCCTKLFETSGSYARASHHRIDVENQSDPAVAKNGCRSDAWNMLIIGFEAFDDDLTLAQIGIDQKGTAHVSFEFDEKRDTFARIGKSGTVIELVADVDRGMN